PVCPEGLWAALQLPERATGHWELLRREGDTLHVLCPYEAWTTNHQEKLWCLLRSGDCKEILRTYYEISVQSRDKRTEIKDNTSSRTVSITMTNLKAEDSDTYFCTAYNGYKGGYPQLRTISLNVFKGEYLYPTCNFCSFPPLHAVPKESNQLRDRGCEGRNTRRGDKYSKEALTPGCWNSSVYSVVSMESGAKEREQEVL
uniref:Ig-like domain-containing protein n=1 Tax=Taeniopygia guttata TaxID=59729 RepID=H0YUC3_TAEGU